MSRFRIEGLYRTRNAHEWTGPTHLEWMTAEHISDIEDCYGTPDMRDSFLGSGTVQLQWNMTPEHLGGQRYDRFAILITPVA